MTTSATDTTPAANSTLPPRRSKYETHGRPEYGHTPETWGAIVASPAAALAREISNQMGELLEKLREWEKTYASSDDPGLDVLIAAGLTVPPYTQKWGTSMKYLDKEFQGLQWILETINDPVHDLIPEPVDEDDAPTATEPAAA
jgi:hypothetical protein